MRPRDEEQSALMHTSASSSTPCLHCSEEEVSDQTRRKGKLQGGGERGEEEGKFRGLD